MGEVRSFDITRRNGDVYTVLLDAADAHLLVGRSWVVGWDGYAQWKPRIDGVRRSFRLHREVMSAELATAPKGTQVDHINGDRLDNRRCNLRLASNAENQRNRGAQKNNTPGRKGVFWHHKARRWEAAIRVDGRKRYLGLFDTVQAAHAAYARAAHRMHGSFANTGDAPAQLARAS